MISSVGVLGPGVAGRVIARLAGRTGITVVPDQVTSADAVVLAVPFATVAQVVAPVTDWGGRLVIDTTMSPPGDTTSRAEGILPLLPRAKVVRAFGAMSARFLDAEPLQPDGRRVVFFAGNDSDGNTLFSDLAARLGFAPVHVGNLRAGGRLLWRDGYLNRVHLLEQTREP